VSDEIKIELGPSTWDTAARRAALKARSPLLRGTLAAFWRGQVCCRGAVMLWNALTVSWIEFNRDHDTK